MTSAENVNKLCNRVLKCVETEHLQVKRTMMVCPERVYEMFTSSQTSSRRFIQHSGSRNNSCRSKLDTQIYYVFTSIASLD